MCVCVCAVCVCVYVCAVCAVCVCCVCVCTCVLCVVCVCACVSGPNTHFGGLNTNITQPNQIQTCRFSRFQFKRKHFFFIQIHYNFLFEYDSNMWREQDGNTPNQCMILGVTLHN